MIGFRVTTAPFSTRHTSTSESSPKGNHRVFTCRWHSVCTITRKQSILHKDNLNSHHSLTLCSEEVTKACVKSRIENNEVWDCPWIRWWSWKGNITNIKLIKKNINSIKDEPVAQLGGAYCQNHEVAVRMLPIRNAIIGICVNKCNNCLLNFANQSQCACDHTILFKDNRYSKEDEQCRVGLSCQLLLLGHHLEGILNTIW